MRKKTNKKSQRNITKSSDVKNLNVLNDGHVVGIFENNEGITSFSFSVDSSLGHEKDGMCMCFDFLDSKPSLETLKANNISNSSVLGNYKYIHIKKGHNTYSDTLKIPSNIEKVKVFIKKWKHNNESKDLISATELKTSSLITDHKRDLNQACYINTTWLKEYVNPGKKISIHIPCYIDGDSNQSALICFDFGEHTLDEKYKNGNGFGLSPVAGYYLYVNDINGFDIFSCNVTLPPVIKTFKVGIRSWNPNSRVYFKSTIFESLQDMSPLSGVIGSEKTVPALLNKVNKLEQELSKSNKAHFNAKNSISYRLGSTLINSKKSISGIIKLPIELYKLREEVKRRKLRSKSPAATSTQVRTRSFDSTKNIKVLSLLDPISHACWSAVFNITPLSHDDYIDQIENGDFDFFFMESCWNANQGSWLYAQTSPNFSHINAQRFLDALSRLKKKNIPIVFWNKEDPMHYDTFINIAKESDFIFTTDTNKVDSYKRDTYNSNVYGLPFAAETSSCNPAGRNSMCLGDICFAGTYYAHDHGDRRDQMDIVLSTLEGRNGVIYDRASGSDSDRYKFPAKYNNYLKPSIPFNEMMDTYKKFNIFLNVNTITNSPSMMSRRVYEILASGTPIISTTSKAIFEQLPGLVLTVKNKEEANLAAEKLLSDEVFWYKKSHLGYRYIHAYCTYLDRAESIAKELGFTVQRATEHFNVIVSASDDVSIKRILTSIKRQKLYNQYNINKIILINSESYSISDDNLSVVGSLDEALSISGSESYSVFMSDKYHYFDNYIFDLLLPFKFTNADITTKASFFKIKDDKLSVFNKRSIHSYVENYDIWQSAFSMSAKENKEPSIYSCDPFSILEYPQKQVSHQAFLYKTNSVVGI
ncbi:CgeB family protein [Aeromonas hydrophila]|uniref:CgeB family protein n=1 Tax=Aeromonas hydrophila TaxID=644 RepID=UPI0030DB4093